MLIHGRSLVYRHEAFGWGRVVSKRIVRPNAIIVGAPFLDENLSFTPGVELLAIELHGCEPGRRNSRAEVVAKCLMFALAWRVAVIEVVWGKRWAGFHFYRVARFTISLS